MDDLYYNFFQCELSKIVLNAEFRLKKALQRRIHRHVNTCGYTKGLYTKSLTFLKVEALLKFR